MYRLYKWRVLVLCSIAFLLVMAPSIAEAEPESGSTYYVATTGSDSNPGTEANPLRTIQLAINKAKAGDTVYVRGGAYHERLTMKSSGTVTQPIRILAYTGELPIVDGEYTLPEGNVDLCDNTVSPPRCKVSQSLVRIVGSHIVFDGFKLTRSRGAGILIGQPTPTEDVTIRNCQLHELRNAAIGSQNISNLLVEGCDIYHAGNFAPYDRPSTQLNWAPIVKAVNSNHLVYRSNRIHENWGEGLAAGVEVSDVVIEDNVIFDNFALQLYVNRTRNVTIQRNLIYHTNNPDFWRGGNPSQCIAMNNEVVDGASITVADVTILNNVVIGCSRNIAIWGSENPSFSFNNIAIMNNVLVNAHMNQGEPAFGLSIVAAASMRNVRVERNIILQNEDNVGRAPSIAELDFSYNLWSHAPPSSMRGEGDVVADPLLVNAGAPLVAGAVQAEWYMPLPASPAVQHNIGPFELLDQAASICCQLYLPLVAQD